MRLSVVVVNWNSEGDLRDCLASLMQQSQAELEIVVVDNGSSDGSVAMVRREFPTVILIEAGENLGFAEGCNRGIARTSGEWLVMLNNDTVVDPGWALALSRAAGAAEDSCGMLQCLMLYRARPDTVNSTGIELTRSGGGRDRSEGLSRSSVSEPAPIFCPTAGAAAYRRTMLEAIRISEGFFDRSHFMYFEDMDLGWRARLAGFGARYVPDSVVFHRWHGSSDRHGRSWLKAIANTNRVRMLLKNASPTLLVATLPATLEGFFVVLRHGGLTGALRLLRAIPASLRSRREVTRLLRVPRRDVERAFRSTSG